MTLQQLHKLFRIIGGNALRRDELLLGPPNIHILSIQA